MFCTTASLASATSPCSRTSSAHDSHNFLVFPATFTVKSSSASSPHDLQVGMVASLDTSVHAAPHDGRARRAQIVGKGTLLGSARAEFGRICRPWYRAR